MCFRKTREGTKNETYGIIEHRDPTRGTGTILDTNMEQARAPARTAASPNEQ